MSLRKIRVGIDVDGVLADLLSPLMKIVSDLLGKTLTVDHVETWDLEELFEKHDALHLVPELWARAREPSFCRKLDPLPGSIEGVRMIQEAGAEVFVVTSPLHDATTWTYDREVWLKEHFAIDRKHVVHTHDKSTFHGHILVDDKPSNVLAWADAQPAREPRTGFLWDQSWNKDVDVSGIVVRTASWMDIVSKIRAFQLSLKAPTHYGHVNNAGVPFIKEASFFIQQGGLTEEWGQHWEPIYDCRSVGEARRTFAKQKHLTLSSIYDGEK